MASTGDRHRGAGGLGILGGTFNPPHLGHLLCADAALDQLGLERVLLVPVCSPPHKAITADPGPEVRLRLCELAAAGDDRLGVSDLEVGRGGTSYTVDTLRRLALDAPEERLTLIVGGDVAQGLESWRDPRDVLSLARLAVAEREGVRRADVLERLRSLEAAERMDFLDVVRFDVSSSAIRRRVAAGRSIRHLVPEGVRVEIEAAGLYTTMQGAQ